MTFRQRFVLIIAIVFAMLLGLSLCGYQYWEVEQQHDNPLGYLLSGASSQTVELETCMDEKTREQIRGVMLDALDEALKNHVVHVFEVWLKDDRGQPGRARTGVGQGIKAYLGARKNTLEWAPPTCSG